MHRRIHYAVNKDAINKSIELYKIFCECPRNENNDTWTEYYDSLRNISIGSHCRVALPSLMQAMEFSGTLTVDNLYYAIIASGINTKAEEYYE